MVISVGGAFGGAIGDINDLNQENENNNERERHRMKDKKETGTRNRKERRKEKKLGCTKSKYIFH